MPKSEIENQAKTGYELALDLADPEDTTKWVPLDAVEKVITEWDAAYDHAAQTANDLCLKLLEANKILKELITNPEVTCFIENGLIPCKAPCARNYENLCKGIQELQKILNQEEAGKKQ